MYRDTGGNICSQRHAHTYFHVPCGQCGECRLSRARMWATRCVHEATLWKNSSFITLTYKDTPPNNSLNPQDTKEFIRRLRYNLKIPFKYFLVGEYGDQNNRPHYHALIFGHDFGLSTKLRNRADESAKETLLVRNKKEEKKLPTCTSSTTQQPCHAPNLIQSGDSATPQSENLLLTQLHTVHSIQ